MRLTIGFGAVTKVLFRNSCLNLSPDNNRTVGPFELISTQLNVILGKCKSYGLFCKMDEICLRIGHQRSCHRREASPTSMWLKVRLGHFNNTFKTV